MQHSTPSFLRVRLLFLLHLLRGEQTFGADEAPADVDVTVVAVALLGVEVVRADDGSVGDHLTARGHAQVTDVVRHRTAQATHQTTWSTRSERAISQSQSTERCVFIPASN